MSKTTSAAEAFGQAAYAFTKACAGQDTTGFTQVEWIAVGIEHERAKSEALVRALRGLVEAPIVKGMQARIRDDAIRSGGFDPYRLAVALLAAYESQESKT